MGPNDTDTGGSGGENSVTMDSTLRNKETGGSNRDTKVGLEVQPNIAITALVFHWPTTAIGTLVLTFLVPISVCHQLALVCGGKPLFSRV